MNVGILLVVVVLGLTALVVAGVVVAVVLIRRSGRAHPVDTGEALGDAAPVQRAGSDGETPAV